MSSRIKRLLMGRPLHNKEIAGEKLSKWKALSIFSSDALSSIGYGPEQIVLILAAPGVFAYGYTWPVASTILVTLGIITVSYAPLFVLFGILILVDLRGVRESYNVFVFPAQWHDWSRGGTGSHQFTLPHGNESDH